MNFELKHFKPEEILSPDGLKQLAKGNLLLDRASALKLDDFRDYINSPLLCNFANLKYRGYRSPNENLKKVHGAGFSRHVQGKAFDLTGAKMPLRELFFKALSFGWSAVGFYQEMNFIHVDNRDMLENKTIVWSGDTNAIVEFSGQLTDEVLSQLKEHILK